MKIEVKNNWENLTYFLNGKQLNENSNGKAILSNNETVNYKSKVVHGTYDDMGHVYPYTTRHLIATIDYSGSKLQVQLKDLDIKEIIEDKPLRVKKQ